MTYNNILLPSNHFKGLIANIKKILANKKSRIVDVVLSGKKKAANSDLLFGHISVLPDFEQPKICQDEKK